MPTPFLWPCAQAVCVSCGNVSCSVYMIAFIGDWKDTAAMFYDLCFGQEAENQFIAKDKLAMAIVLGYDCTAVNRISDRDFVNRCALTFLFGAFQEDCCIGRIEPLGKLL